jgi:hypothetical protein
MKTSTKIKTIFLAGILAAMLLITNGAQAQLTVDTTYTPQSLVTNVLLGTGVTVTNITCNCTPGAYSFFDGNNSNIGIAGGVLLTTGRARIAIGPNNSPSAGVDNGVVLTDSQLISIDPNATHDPCILEFDFVPDSSHIQFKYVFGSEEYNDYVNSTFNDVFGFFLTGPGILNPNNNIALIPLTTIPIAINNVNNGYSAPNTASAGPCNHCQYFYDNLNGTTIQYDAFTTVLTASATVTPNLTYHIKLAVADASDGVYDSGVFLQCGSFTSCEGCGNQACTMLTNTSNLAFAISDLAVYPNPVGDVLNISFSSKLDNAGEAIVTNMIGQEIYKQTLDRSMNQQISTKQLKDGIYLLQIRCGNELVNRKFIVAH